MFVHIYVVDVKTKKTCEKNTDSVVFKFIQNLYFRPDEYIHEKKITNVY